MARLSHSYGGQGMNAIASTVPAVILPNADVSLALNNRLERIHEQ